MGTSHSYSLTPKWAGAKFAITTYLKQEDASKKQDALDKYFKIFSASVQDVQSYYEGHNHAAGSFGHAGKHIASRVYDLLVNAKKKGFAYAVISLANTTDEKTLESLTGVSLLTKLFEIIIGDDNASFDDDAAKCALQKLLIKLLCNCDTFNSIEEVITNSTDEQCKDWIVDFYIDYIVEYNEIMLSSHIFSKSKDPRSVAEQIKKYLKNSVLSKLGDDLNKLNIFSPKGKLYIDQLLGNILTIWAE